MKTEKITIELHPVLADYLRSLLAGGLYGCDLETTCRWLLSDCVRLAILQKEIPLRWLPRTYESRSSV